MRTLREQWLSVSSWRAVAAAVAARHKKIIAQIMQMLLLRIMSFQYHNQYRPNDQLRPRRRRKPAPRRQSCLRLLLPKWRRTLKIFFRLFIKLSPKVLLVVTAAPSAMRPIMSSDSSFSTPTEKPTRRRHPHFKPPPLEKGRPVEELRILEGTTLPPRRRMTTRLVRSCPRRRQRHHRHH